MKWNINFNLTKNRVTAVLFIQLPYRYLVLFQHTLYNTGLGYTAGGKNLNPWFHIRQQVVLVDLFASILF